MRSRSFRRLGTVAAVIFVLLVADTAHAQRRGRLRGRFGRGGAAPTSYAPWYDSSAWSGVVPASFQAEADQPAAEADVPGTGTVTFNVRLPMEDAQLWMAGRQRPGTGTLRTLSVSHLPLGQSYTYFFKCVYSRDGRVVTDTREVACHAGDRITVNFTLPNPRGTSVEIVPEELPAPAKP